jgi:IS5 family transposase
MQLAFGDAEDLGQCKQTRREVFLAVMEQVVPPPRRNLARHASSDHPA